jgi:hypothetical protein
MKTPYQQKVLNRAIMRSASLPVPTDNTHLIEILLIAIEQKDIVLMQHYNFFGPGRKESEKIAKVLELP